MLLDLVFLLQQLHPAKPGDAIGQVHDQITLAQIEKAIDRAALDPPLTSRRPSDIGSTEQFVIADDDQLLVEHVEAALDVAQTQRDVAECRRVAQQVFQALAFALVVAGDQHSSRFACEKR